MAINRWKCAGAGAPGRLTISINSEPARLLTVTVDGVPVENPQQYWTPPKAAAGEAEMFWSYPLPALEPGAHVIEFVVWSDKKLTDGLDENGDGQLDTYGPGNILIGYVEVVVPAVDQHRALRQQSPVALFSVTLPNPDWLNRRLPGIAQQPRHEFAQVSLRFTSGNHIERRG